MGILDSARRSSARVRALGLRVLDTVPPVRRTMDELLRVELVDRAMVIAAQGLLALIPLVVVLAAFLPSDLTSAGVQRFGDVTGLAQASTGVANDAISSVADESVRTQVGLVGLVVAVLSASSFARAVMRAYERIWALPSVKGLRGRRRALAWLLGWLVAMQLLQVATWLIALLGDRGAGVLTQVLVDVAEAGVRAVVLCLLWWCSLRILLHQRVPWGALVVPAVLTGVCLTAYSAGSAVVMPRYATSTTEEFGAFGLVLALAAWLVGFAGILVVAAVVGRVLVEDPWLRRWSRGAVGRWSSVRGRGPDTGPDSVGHRHRVGGNALGHQQPD